MSTFALGQSLARIQAWHDVTGEGVDTRAAEVLVGGLSTTEGEYLFALALYPDDERILCVRCPGEGWGRIPLAQSDLSSLRERITVSRE